MTPEQVEELEESLASREIDISLLQQEVKMLTFQNFVLVAEVKSLKDEIKEIQCKNEDDLIRLCQREDDDS